MKKNVVLLKKVLPALVIGTTVAGGLAISNKETVYAHGYILNNREHLAQQGFHNAGRAAYEPQSVGEYSSTNFHNGTTPLYTAITAHANSTTGNLAYPLMADQSQDRWHKVDKVGGPNQINWKIYANHRTMYVDYYITKADWDPNQPLTLDSFEKIERITYHSGSDFWNAPLLPLNSNNIVSHNVNLPTDRSGYHILFSEWFIADTGNSFFKVQDINLINNNEYLVAPSAPTNLQAEKVTNDAVKLTWSRPEGSVSYYEIYRSDLDRPIATTNVESFLDETVEMGRDYEYFIYASNDMGDSLSSEKLTVRTSSWVVPSPVTNLNFTMGSHPSIVLTWDDPNSEDCEYYIFRSVYGDDYNIDFLGITSDPFFRDRDIELETRYSYYVTTVYNNISSIPSIKVVASVPFEAPRPRD